MLRVLKIIGLAIIAILVLGGGYFWWTTTVKDLPPGTLDSDASVTVTASAYGYALDPVAATEKPGLVFIAGAFVPALAYVPFGRALAAVGHPVRIIGLELGVAQLPGQQDALKATVASLMTADRSWAVGGHSLGSYYASEYALAHSDGVTGLFMAGTGNPYVDLSELAMPVTIVNGSNDNIVNSRNDPARASYAPPNLDSVVIDGGNHAGFAFYGPQIGDGTATISKTAQMEQMAAAALALLERAGGAAVSATGNGYLAEAA